MRLIDRLARTFRRRSAIVLCPASAYHVDELGPLAETLATRGHEVRFLVAQRRLPSVEPALSRYPFPVAPFRKNALPIEELASSTAALVALKDWGAYRPLFEICKQHGVPNFAKVEGAQDFDDVDVPWERGPYRTAEVILCQGQNDFDNTQGRRHIVGNSNLERIWLQPPRVPVDETAIINLNFTFGVLEEERDAWLRSAIEGCRAAGHPYLISRHPDETALVSDPNVTPTPMRDLLETAGSLVSRFSTVPFEAMARGVPFIYHKPPAEQVSTFRNPDGAFDVSTSIEELAEALTSNESFTTTYRKRCAEFFLRQVDVDPAHPSEVRTADIIEAAL